MRVISKWFVLISVSILLFNCQTGEGAADAVFEKLKDEEAKIIFTIDGKAFYPEESIFKGAMMFTDQMMSITLTDQFEGKTMMNIGGENWFTQKPLKREIRLENAFEGSLKMGKLIDVKNMIGEGYMMTEGNIEALSLSKEKIVFKITGKVGKYSDFNQPDRYLPIEGLIVYKKPVFSLAKVNEADIFSPSKAQ